MSEPSKPKAPPFSTFSSGIRKVSMLVVKLFPLTDNLESDLESNSRKDEER